MDEKRFEGLRQDIPGLRTYIYYNFDGAESDVIIVNCSKYKAHDYTGMSRAKRLLIVATDDRTPKTTTSLLEEAYKKILVTKY